MLRVEAAELWPDQASADAFGVISFGGGREEEATLKAISDASIPTITLEAGVRPQRNVSELVGRVLAFLAMAIAGGVALVIQHLKSKRDAERRREAMQPR